MYDWHRSLLQGQNDRRNGKIILLDDGGAEVVRWVFREAWPRKWEGPRWNAMNNEVAIETYPHLRIDRARWLGRAC